MIDHIDELRFLFAEGEARASAHLYEAKIRNMGNAGSNGGEYYTPRPLIRAMVRVVNPKIGERIYDGAVGSAGFLCESYDYLKQKPGLTTKDVKQLQEKTFYGKEKKSLAYVIAIMNMILHGIETPEHHPHQHADGEPRRYPGEGTVRRDPGESAVRRTSNEVQQLPDPHGRDRVFVFAALHQDAEGRGPCGRGDQEYVG